MTAIDGARGILLNISGGSDLTLFEVNEAASVIHEVAHRGQHHLRCGHRRWDGRRRSESPS
ncbi:MAG: hypothetical protein R2735_03045 [Microthrixaceae bacterium]